MPWWRYYFASLIQTIKIIDISCHILNIEPNSSSSWTHRFRITSKVDMTSESKNLTNKCHHWNVKWFCTSRMRPIQTDGPLDRRPLARAINRTSANTLLDNMVKLIRYIFRSVLQFGWVIYRTVSQIECSSFFLTSFWLGPGGSTRLGHNRNTKYLFTLILNIWRLSLDAIEYILIIAFELTGLPSV